MSGVARSRRSWRSVLGVAPKRAPRDLGAEYQRDERAERGVGKAPDERHRACAVTAAFPSVRESHAGEFKRAVAVRVDDRDDRVEHQAVTVLHKPDVYSRFPE